MWQCNRSILNAKTNSFFVFLTSLMKTKNEFVFRFSYFTFEKTKNQKGIRFSFFICKFENEKRKNGIYTDPRYCHLFITVRHFCGTMSTMSPCSQDKPTTFVTSVGDTSVDAVTLMFQLSVPLATTEMRPVTLVRSALSAATSQTGGRTVASSVQRVQRQ